MDNTPKQKFEKDNREAQEPDYWETLETVPFLGEKLQDAADEDIFWKSLTRQQFLWSERRILGDLFVEFAKDFVEVVDGTVQG